MRSCSLPGEPGGALRAGGGDAFLAAYETVTGEEYDWYWELASILEHGPDHFTPEQVAESEPYLAQAVEAISGSRPTG